jgi:ribosomal protein S18 acetylase RimI-like enzyme
VAREPVRPAPAIDVQPLRFEDIGPTLDLINADRLPGQPICNRRALDMALRGESPTDAHWWKELTNVTAVVAKRGRIVAGVAAFAIAAADRSGWLLWLHAGEDREVVEALVDHVLNELRGSSHIYAFWIATALTLGVEALPVERRPVSHEVLTSRALVGRDSWRFMVANLDGLPAVTEGQEVAAVVPNSGPGELPAWRLIVGDPNEPMASAEIALGPDGCGVLWWIEVEPAHRGRGMGRALLQQAMRFLALRGAQTVAGCVDHDDPRDRDRRPAVRLLESVGFEDVDHLWSYESPRKRSY